LAGEMSRAEVRQLRLQEYGTVDRVALSPEERDLLMAVVSDLRVEPVKGEREFYSLTAGSTVGTVSLAGLSVEILPKVPIERVVFMLSYALDEAQWSSAVDVQRAQTLVEAMASVLVWHVERTVHRGLLHGYRVEEAALPGVRGRIRIEDQIRVRFGRPLPVEVRFDEFTDDILENRLLKTALQVVGQQRLRHQGLAASIRHAMQHFALVGTVPAGRMVPSVAYTRLNEHYRAAVEWARLILKASAFETRLGGATGRSLLFDMNAVFEQFVRAAIRDELRSTDNDFPDGRRCPRRWLDRGRRIGLEPDLSWWRDGECVFVGDLKYKWLEEKARNADLFQLLSYTLGFDLPTGLLIYAGEREEIATHEIPLPGKQLRIMSMRLDGTLMELQSECRRVADEVRRMAAELRSTRLPVGIAVGV